MPETRSTIEGRWRILAKEFLKDYNGTRAYMECGAYRVKNHKVASANFSGLLGKPRFQEILQEEQQARITRLDLDVDKIVLEELRIAHANIADYMEWDDDSLVLKSSRRLTKDQLAAVQSVKISHGMFGTSVELKLFPKQPSIESLKRQLGMYDADNRRRHIIEESGVAEVPGPIDAEFWDATVAREVDHAKHLSQASEAEASSSMESE